MLSQVEIASPEEDRVSMREESREQEEYIDYFVRPEPSMLQNFLDHLPQQISKNSVVQKVFTCKYGTSRKWLTYSERHHWNVRLETYALAHRGA